MSFCQRCPIPEILSDISDSGGKDAGEFWENEEIRVSAIQLVGALANAKECLLGPIGEPWEEEPNWRGGVICRHPNSEEIARIGETLEDFGHDYPVLTILEAEDVRPYISGQ